MHRVETTFEKGMQRRLDCGESPLPQPRLAFTQHPSIRKLKHMAPSRIYGSVHLLFPNGRAGMLLSNRNLLKSMGYKNRANAGV